MGCFRCRHRSGLMLQCQYCEATLPRATETNPITPLSDDSCYYKGMKALCMTAAVLSLALFVLGCEGNPVEEYGTGLVNAYQSTGQKADRASLSLLKTSIRTFHTAHGRYPESLEELSQSTGTRLDPSHYDYDPATGEIALK